MIEKIDDFKQLDAFKINDLYTVRIKSLAAAYGFGYSFVSFYRQLISDHCTAVICYLDSDAVLSYDSECADADELLSFFTMKGFSTLLCRDDFHMDCRFDSGFVMECGNKCIRSCGYEIRSLNSFDEFKKLYDFVGYEGSFEAWYADISRRVRTGTSAACCVLENGKMISCAVLSSIYDNCAVLSGVQTKPEFRKKGIGSGVVSHICRQVPGTVYIMRELNKNEHFYSELGFKNNGKWRIYG